MTNLELAFDLMQCSFLDTKVSEYMARVTLGCVTNKLMVALGQAYRLRGAIACWLVALAALTVASNSAAAQTADPINGGVTVSGTTNCSGAGVGNSTCYAISVQCSGIDGSGIAALPVTVKVTNPGSPKGAIIFVSTGGGTSYYDQSFTYGAFVVNSVLQAGFTTVQPFFGGTKGWLQGPAPNGVRALVCRFAAVANWVATSTSPLMHQSGTALCTAGVSGGASAIAYSLAHFGMGTGATRIFDMVQVTSGPTFSRLDRGCVCDQAAQQTTTGQGPLSDCYVDAGSLVDNTYSSPVCTTSKKTHDTANESVLYHDSIMSDDPPFLNYSTAVRVVFGAQNDLGGAVPQGLEWVNAITSPLTVNVIGDAAHIVPDTVDGAVQIANDLNTACVLQTPRR
ncbi:MAG: hypothetical protein JWQ87_3239 [Candidatus Sulfotelmatobacter sp.]|nr:hypothetical protein [Candidatus Sulfotelmatobacter sp.]